MKRKFNKKNIYSIDFKIANRTKYYIKCIFFIINYHKFYILFLSMHEFKPFKVGWFYGFN